MPLNVGEYLQDNYLRIQHAAFSGTPDVIISPALDYLHGVSFQLITEDRPARSVPHDAADAVVASTGTWHFVNGNFDQGDVGGTIAVANAANGGNNGTKTILTVPDSTH